MQNLEKAKGHITLTLGGEERRLAYTVHSVAQVKYLTGKNFLKGELDSNDPDDLAILVWAGLITWDESLDGDVTPAETAGAPGTADENVRRAVKWVQKSMNFDQMYEIANKVRQALEVSAPPPAKKK